MKTASTTMKTPRPVITAIIICLGIAAFFYSVLPRFTSATDYFTSRLADKIHSSHPDSKASFCTEEIGEGLCCDLYLGAEPCVDECRKNYVDRETFTLTKEFDECRDHCLTVYQETCRKENGLPMELDNDSSLDTEKSSAPS